MTLVSPGEKVKSGLQKDLQATSKLCRLGNLLAQGHRGGRCFSGLLGSVGVLSPCLSLECEAALRKRNGKLLPCLLAGWKAAGPAS